jgi:hypothetical protein
LNNEKVKFHRLYWYCTESEKRYFAGVAFYNEDKGDYRLKVDMLPEGKAVYLKPSSVSEGVIIYRLEMARKRGYASPRVSIGTGHSHNENGYPIFIDIGPFNRTLVLEAA